VYLLHFGRIVVSGGGFQYQQLVNSDQWVRLRNPQGNPSIILPDTAAL
jgi:hypothetical protein